MLMRYRKNTMKIIGQRYIKCVCTVYNMLYERNSEPSKAYFTHTLRKIPVRDDDSEPNGKLLSYGQQTYFINDDKTNYYE